VEQGKRVPVLINYEVGNKRYDKNQIYLILNSSRKLISATYPIGFLQIVCQKEANLGEMIMQDNPYSPFFTKRNLWLLPLVE